MREGSVVERTDGQYSAAGEPCWWLQTGEGRVEALETLLAAAWRRRRSPPDLPGQGRMPWCGTWRTSTPAWSACTDPAALAAEETDLQPH